MVVATSYSKYSENCLLSSQKKTHLAFEDKVKKIYAYIPEKVKIYIEDNLFTEMEYFQKKYSFEVKILSNDKFIIPEYKIDLLNKSKKVINTIENINQIQEIKKNKVHKIKEKKAKDKSSKEKIKKTKSTKKKIRTLWVRKKKKVK